MTLKGLSRKSALVGVLMAMIFIHSGSIMVLSQYFFSPSNPRCFIGPYRVTYNSTVPLSFGYSSVQNTKFNTSTNFFPIKYGTSVNNYLFRVDTSSSYSDGDYFVFIGPIPFTIAWAIQPAFEDVNSVSNILTVLVPAGGFSRIYSEGWIDSKQLDNTIYVSSDNEDSYTLNIAFTWEETEKPSYTPCAMSNSKAVPVKLKVPFDSLIERKVAVFIHLKCSSPEPCKVKLGCNENFSGFGDAFIGLIFGLILVCALVGCCAIGFSVLVRTRRMAMRGMSTIPAEKYQAVIVVGQPQMPPVNVSAQYYHQPTISSPVQGTYISQPQNETYFQPSDTVQYNAKMTYNGTLS